MTYKNWTEEEQIVLDKVMEYIDLKAHVFGKPERGIIKIEKRNPMYGGDGIVYMLSFFEADELVNNRIACYMVLLNKGDQAGFHEHGNRHEQELYIVVNGSGKYIERVGNDRIIKESILKKGSITAINGIDNYHSVINNSDEPLIIFVVTTNEKQMPTA